MSSAENLISTLLEISKLDAGALRAEPKPFALTELFDQLSQEFQLIADQRNIAFKAKSRDASGSYRPQTLRRVLQNFLSNALRYTEPMAAFSLPCGPLGHRFAWKFGIRELVCTRMICHQSSTSLNGSPKASRLRKKVSALACQFLNEFAISRTDIKSTLHPALDLFFGDIAVFRVTTRITQPTTSVSFSNAVSATYRSDRPRDR